MSGEFNEEVEEYDNDYEKGFLKRFEEEEPSMEAEAKAFERTGTGFITGTKIIGGPLEKIQERLNRTITSPEERFLEAVNAIVRTMISDGKLNLSEGDISVLLETAQNSMNIRYKNPTAYILGYVATNGGVTMDKKSVMKAISISKKLPQ